MIPKDLKRGVLSEDGLYDLIDDYLQYKSERKGSFQYQAVFDQHHFTLHDCRVTSINYENRCLTFEIPGGIYCEKYGNDWPNTGKAAVRWNITGEDEAYLQVFIREDCKTVRYEYDLENMTSNVNSGNWQLELGYRYRGLAAIIYIGYIWLEEEPWHYQMQLMVASRENEILFWNDPDK
ncbi:MAG: DUF4298 domain-containing protein [Erysipelotrichaceae bacterium]|nr:DUF4298 domain-containing protein [Erysipelotrichaceae bacterium]